MMHFRFRHARFAGVVLAASCMCLAAQASENLHVLNFSTKVGSFKALGTDHPAKGVLTINFTGTVLVSGLNGKLTLEGNILKEYDDPKHKKQVYHGTGKMTVDGEYTGIQFFGRDLSGRFSGVSLFRFYGEFDKDLETGFYWYDGGEKKDWGTGGMLTPVPGYTPAMMRGGAPPVPQVKVKH